MHNSKNISELNDCFMDIFAYILNLKGTCAFESPNFRDVYRKTRRLFSQSIDLTLGLGVDPRKYDKARYAVCAWADEMLSTMSWPHNQKWLNYTLQKQYYGTSNANTAFFTRLNALQSEEHSVREIYLYCLYLGYYGKYVLESDKPLLKQLKMSHLISLVDRKSMFKSLNETSIFRDAYPIYVPGKSLTLAIPSKPRFPVLLTVILTALVLLVSFISYLAFSIIMEQKITNLAIFLAKM